MTMIEVGWAIIIIGWIIGISGILIGAYIEICSQRGSFDKIFMKSNVMMWIVVCIGLITWFI